MGRRIVWCALALLLTAGDCRTPGPKGTKGRFEFYYIDSSDAAFPLPLIPFADGGTHATVTASPVSSGGCGGGGAAPTFTQVMSSDPSIAAVTLVNGDIDVVTGTAGTAELQLLDASGALVDSIALEIEPVASLELANPGPAHVMVGSYDLAVTMKDVTGRDLGGGSGRIHATATGGATVSQLDRFTGTVLTIAVPAPGAVSVTATAEAASATLDLTAIAPTDVTSIVPGTDSWKPYYNPNDQTYVVWAQALDTAGPVYGAKCAWQVDDPSVTLSSSRGADLGDDPYLNAQFKLSQPGSFPATCTIGNAQMTITLGSR